MTAKTNQQEAPKALRLADALQAVEEGWSVADKCCAELRRLHAENERLAALVKAQQPAPSAAAAGKWSLGEIDGNWRDIDLPGHGGVMRIVWRMEDDEGRNEKLEAQAHAVIAALNTPQPSPTPQASSQPAPVNTRQIAECYGDCPTDPKTCANPCKFDGRAARAPAASVTAPAGGAVAISAASASEQFDRFPAGGNAIDAVRYAKKYGAREVPAYGSRGNPLMLYPDDLARMLAASAAPTQPTQAADSVLEDAARLWDEFLEAWRQEVGVDKIINIMGGADKLKAVFLAAARKQGANHD